MESDKAVLNINWCEAVLIIFDHIHENLHVRLIVSSQ